MDVGGREGDGAREETEPNVAGLQLDEDVRLLLEGEERNRKEREIAEGKGVKVLEYTPAGADVGRLRHIIVVIVVLAVILIPVFYMVVIPRADARLVINYHEGLVGGINVDARIENHGTRVMTDVTVTMVVQNSTDVRMADPTVFEGRVPAHSDGSMDAVSFQGDQWETYHIFVEWSFDCAGHSYHGSEHYHTEGDAMNMWFFEDITR